MPSPLLLVAVLRVSVLCRVRRGASGTYAFLWQVIHIIVCCPRSATGAPVVWGEVCGCLTVTSFPRPFVPGPGPARTARVRADPAGSVGVGRAAGVRPRLS